MLNSSYLPKWQEGKLSSHEDFVINSKGVDFFNQKCYQFRYPHGCRKWWKPLFFYLVQVCIHNSFILFREVTRSKIFYKTFYYQIIMTLLGQKTSKKKKVFHLVRYIDPEKRSSHRLTCKICKSKTSWCCSTCQLNGKLISLCIPNCFRIFHENL